MIIPIVHRVFQSRIICRHTRVYCSPTAAASCYIYIYIRYDKTLYCDTAFHENVYTSLSRSRPEATLVVSSGEGDDDTVVTQTEKNGDGETAGVAEERKK